MGMLYLLPVLVTHTVLTTHHSIWSRGGTFLHDRLSSVLHGIIIAVVMAGFSGHAHRRSSSCFVTVSDFKFGVRPDLQHYHEHYYILTRLSKLE